MDKSTGCYFTTTIEVVALLYYFFMTMAQISSILMYQVKICFEKLDSTLTANDTSFFDMIGDDIDNCFHLNDEKFKEALDIVSKKQSDIQAVGMALQIIPNAIACLIIVNAGNILGRKMVLSIVLMGYIISHVSFILNWYYIDASVWWMLMESWHILWGGRAVLTVTFIMYINDITSDKWRSTRLNCIGFIELFATSLGAIVSGWFLDAPMIKDKGPEGDDFYGFYAVFGCALIINLMCMIWTMFILKETNISNETLSLKKIFTLKHILESFKCIFKQRKDGSRWIVLCLISLYYLVCVQYDGMYLSPALLLYFQGLGWSYTQFTTLIGVNGIVILVSCVTIVPILMLKLRWDDMTIGLVGSALFAIAVTTYTICPYGNYYVPYIGMSFSVLSGTNLTVVKSSLTKNIPPTELTKLMAVVGMLQAFAGLGAPVSSLIYSASIDGCPNIKGGKDWCATIFLWVGLSVLLVNVTLYFLLGRGIKRRHPNSN